MIATPTSNVLRMIRAFDAMIEFEIELANFSANAIKMCPATMLAVSRTERVMGRIIFLVSSIRARAGIRAVGEPFGTMCARKFFVFLILLHRLIVIHIDRAIGRFSAI